MSQESVALTAFQLLEKTFESNPDKEAVYDGYRRLTYRKLYAEVTQLASGLTQMGIVKGDRVAVCLPNWNEFVSILFAITKIGAVLVPFNTRYRTDEVEYILKNSGAKAAFFTREFDAVNHFEQFLEAKRNVPSLERMFTVRFQEEGFVSYDNLLEIGKDQAEPAAELEPAEDLFSILYTSGTTGKPKGTMLTHRNVVNVALIATEKMKCTPDDVFLIPVPVFHVMGMMFLLRTVTSCSKMVLMDNYKAETALTIIQDEKVTIHPGVPTMFILELNHPSFKSYDLSSLRTGEMAAAPCPVEVVRRIRSEMGCEILVAYGMTETSSALTLTDFTDDDIYRAETVGKAVTGVEVKAVDNDRKTVAAGEVGELACRSVGLMKGYYNMEEQTREVMDADGWFYTGDLATIDEHGYVRIVGRKKDLIIRGGFNIYPREIEETFYTHPSVLEIAIVGLPDSVLGEISCAAIRLKEGMTAMEEELKSFIKEKVANYKVPDKIIFLDQLPMTASGKISKVELQKQLKNNASIQLR